MLNVVIIQREKRKRIFYRVPHGVILLNLRSLGLYQKFIMPIISNNKTTVRRKLLKKMPKNSVCAELGVAEGLFSEEIIKITKPKKLVLIDNWEEKKDFSDTIKQKEHDLNYNAVKEKFQFNPVVQIIKGLTNSINTFPDNYFDWVYIDADHRYEGVKKDLENCYPKIKPGGYIIGDDYLHETYGDYILGVVEAVDEFVKTHGIKNFEVFNTQFMIKLK
jgi:hypothetical protein